MAFRPNGSPFSVHLNVESSYIFVVFWWGPGNILLNRLSVVVYLAVECVWSGAIYFLGIKRHFSALPILLVNKTIHHERHTFGNIEQYIVSSSSLVVPMTISKSHMELKFPLRIQVSLLLPATPILSQ